MDSGYSIHIRIEPIFKNCSYKSVFKIAMRSFFTVLQLCMDHYVFTKEHLETTMEICKIYQVYYKNCSLHWTHTYELNFIMLSTSIKRHTVWLKINLEIVNTIEYNCV